MSIVQSRTERELADAVEQLRSVVNNVVDGIITIDQRGTIMTFNPAAERIFAYEAAEVVGQNVKMLMPEPYHGEHDRYVADYLHTGVAKIIGIGREVVGRRKDGSTFPLDLGVSGFHLGDQRYFTGIVRDITERKRVEAILASEDPFRLLVEGVTDSAIFMLDSQGRVATWNAGAERIKGYKSQEIIGQYLSAFYTPEAVERGWPQHELDVAQREGRFQDEGWRVRKDGSQFWANVLITALRDEAGTLVGFSKITRDLSERKRAEEAIQAANAALEDQVRQRTLELQHTVEELGRSNIDLQQFAYVASHDLQEPLRAVAGCAQILQKRYKGQLDARADELIGHAVDGVNRMQTLINDLLAYSRLGTCGKGFEPTDCNDMLKMALANLASAVAEAGAVITHDDLPTVPADGVQLTQVFQNLLGNAIKFRGEVRPAMHVGVQPRPGEWLFSVRDNGIGIEPEYFGRIFVIFQRLHTRNEYPGTGIGLAICKKIVERHGGRMLVESAPGRGSTFFFTIPAGGGTPQ